MLQEALRELEVADKPKADGKRGARRMSFYHNDRVVFTCSLHHLKSYFTDDGGKMMGKIFVYDYNEDPRKREALAVTHGRSDAGSHASSTSGLPSAAPAHSTTANGALDNSISQRSSTLPLQSGENSTGASANISSSGLDGVPQNDGKVTKSARDHIDTTDTRQAISNVPLPENRKLFLYVPKRGGASDAAPDTNVQYAPLAVVASAFAKKRSETFHNSMVRHESDTGESAAHALIVNSDSSGKAQSLLAVIVDPDLYQGVLAMPHPSIAIDGSHQTVIGHHQDNEAVFSCDEKKLRSCFHTDGRHVDLQFYNQAEFRAEMAKAAKKKEKWQAKKQRQREAASATISDPTLSVVEYPLETGAHDASSVTSESVLTPIDAVLAATAQVVGQAIVVNVKTDRSESNAGPAEPETIAPEALSDAFGNDEVGCEGPVNAIAVSAQIGETPVHSLNPALPEQHVQMTDQAATTLDDID